MNSLDLYYVLHIAGVIFLTAATFMIFAGAPDERRSFLLAVTGVLSVIALFGGFGLASSKLGNIQQPNPGAWPWWLWVKVVCWLGLSAVGGIAYRRRQLTPVWVTITVVLVLVALLMVYTKSLRA